MTHFTRVLAAVDFSKPARGAFEYALALSRHRAAELVVVHAVPPNQAFNWHARQRLALMARLRRRAEQANVKFRDRVQQGDPAEIILLHARSLHPDVIVMGTHQRSGMKRLGSRSVAERVAARATVPVFVVPPRPGTGRGRPFSHVAVAVDFSRGSHAAVERALALASDSRDRVTLLHVVPGLASGVPPHLYRYATAEYQNQLMRDAQRRLRLAVPARRNSAAAIHARVLVGDPTREISRVVDSIGADVLVVGVSRRGVVSRALFGTTAARLLRVTRVPIMAVPEADELRGHQESPALPLAA